MRMIQVVTTVELRPECLAKFLAILVENTPKVKAEDGCLAYEVMMDIASGLPTQGEVRQRTVTLIEAWDNLEALQAHLTIPHMTTFREAVKDYVQRVSHQVLQPV